MRKYGKAIKKKTYRKKRGGVRRKTRMRASMVISRTSPIPDRFFTKLRYSHSGALSYVGLGVPIYYQYRINSIYDPDLSGAGHQPLGRDQLESLYNRYRVYGMRYRLVPTNRETAYVGEMAIVLRPNAVVHTSMDTIMESPYVQRRILMPFTSGSSTTSISGYASVAKVRGVSKMVVKTDDEYQSIMNDNPVVQPTLTIYYQNQTTNVTGTLVYRLDIEYLVECFDRKILTSS